MGTASFSRVVHRGFSGCIAALPCGLLAVSALLLAGCTTNSYIRSAYKVEPVPRSRLRVFVENRELKKEFRVLKQARLYDISKEPEEPIHVVLRKMKNGGFCGTGLIRAIYTLGTLPGRAGPLTPYRFDYVIRDSSGEHAFSYELRDIYHRMSLWEWLLKPFKSDARALGKVLRTEALHAERGESTDQGL